MFDNNNPWNLGSNKSSGNTRHQEDDLISKTYSQIKDFFYRYNQDNNSKKSYSIIFIIVFLIYVCTGFYIVHPSEESIELTFGKYFDTKASGLRYHFPYPIGKIFKVNVKEINREEIGMSNLYGKDTDRGEGVMLTGDENIVNVNFEVQWRVQDSHNYLFKVRDYIPGASVKNAAESAMREIIGKNMISFALEGQGRAEISRDTRLLLQQILDGYQMGIEVLSVQMKKIDPPEKVISSFRDVQSARADKERTINEAYSYSNDIIPRAKGEAIKVKLDAEAYYNEIINEAKGTTSHFLSLYEQYKQNPALVKNLIYLETMESIFSKLDKMVITDDLKGFFSYLPITNLGN
ncbi:FtsH protease activity modulator HflK [Wolbachia endosymbiont of Howardula sp.]|uniref:FtsH protease activity modulator HflK n=1 Tax=Wolbachia endosymbiont of Howardula sp. TaxID=2916816 RepID=UPI00217E7168|nr:FtsH protease activity modulator HflK [Wolbachia endosymbiont of Howardula sp.]UWI83115.1 FtsH protease activity modulator HflK [Wolbachia endosymbiont of Howardula sp.]